jgi:hypothetical protein
LSKSAHKALIHHGFAGSVDATAVLAARGDIMLETLLRSPHGATPDPALASALAHAAAAIARLDQALGTHPLRPAFLHRARLDAVRRQAAIDGLAIDPWHLAAVLEGLRLRMDHALRLVDRGAIFDAARHALALHQWLVAPDFDQENAVRRAETALSAPAGATPLLAAAYGMHAWIDRGGDRQALRAALVRFWTKHRLLHTPVPLTGDHALDPDVPWDRDTWVPAFLAALAGEASDALQRLVDLERAWLAARRAVAGRRRNSRAALAVDILAAAPLVSATSLAAGLGMAVKNGAALLDAFCAADIAVEVTHRSKRRLFGLTGLAPLRDAVRPPYRPDPTRGRGRPRLDQSDDPADSVVLPLPPAPLTPIDRRQFDYSDLGHWMAQTDQAIRHARCTLSALAQPTPPAADLSNEPLDTCEPAPSLDIPTDWDHQREHPASVPR